MAMKLKHKRCGCDKPHRSHEPGCKWHHMSDKELGDALAELSGAMLYVLDRAWCLRGAMEGAESHLGRRLYRLMTKQACLNLKHSEVFEIARKLDPEAEDPWD